MLFFSHMKKNRFSQGAAHITRSRENLLMPFEDNKVEDKVTHPQSLISPFLLANYTTQTLISINEHISIGLNAMNLLL